MSELESEGSLDSAAVCKFLFYMCHAHSADPEPTNEAKSGGTDGPKWNKGGVSKLRKHPETTQDARAAALLPN